MSAADGELDGHLELPPDLIPPRRVAAGVGASLGAASKNIPSRK